MRKKKFEILWGFKNEPTLDIAWKLPYNQLKLKSSKTTSPNTKTKRPNKCFRAFLLIKLYDKKKSQNVNVEWW